MIKGKKAYKLDDSHVVPKSKLSLLNHFLLMNE